MDARLRSFQAGDRGAALALSRRALSRPDEQVGLPLWETEEELEAELGGLDIPAAETLHVVEEEGQVAGIGGIELEDEATVFGPLVAPPFRGRKLGTMLLLGSVELARERGVERLSAAAGARNRVARLLLEGAGFRPRGAPDAVFRLAPQAHRPLGQPKPGVTTRDARPNDTAHVLDLCHECFAQSRLSDEAWERSLARGQVRLAEEDGDVVAVTRINPARRRVFHGVTAHARARGVGGFVLSEALADYWRQHPGQVLRLPSPVENVAASRLYRRQGFAPWLVLQTFELEL